MSPAAAASEHSEIRRQLWLLAKTGPGTSRIAALRALREMDDSDAAEIDWGAVVAAAGECPVDARAQLLGRLAQMEARDRSAAQLLVARCTGLEVDPVVADQIAVGWSQPDADLLEAMRERGVVSGLEAHARQLEAQHRGCDRAGDAQGG